LLYRKPRRIDLVVSFTHRIPPWFGISKRGATVCALSRFSRMFASLCGACLDAPVALCWGTGGLSKNMQNY